MSIRPKAGLLPFYIKLYDRFKPDACGPFDEFLRQIADELNAKGLEVQMAPVCRTEDEFRQALATLETGGLDAVITLHLAYSPSMESIDVLARCRLPLIVLDTTMDHAFDQNVDPARIMFNHGIHGVQDLCTMLRRRGKHFEIVAGHWRESDVLTRTIDLVRAAKAARKFRSARVLRIGEAFCGMGDFSVPKETLRNALGIQVNQIAAQELAPLAGKVTEAQIRAELEEDRRRFNVDCDEQAHRRSLRIGLALRQFMNEGRFDAFSANFLAFDRAEEPINAMPFLEASKAMARGLGYAGEGDVLTAALVAGLLTGFEQTTFTEIFCPDWKGNSLFLSHMGEINPNVAAAQPLLLEKPFPYTPAKTPAFLAAAPAPGPAVYVNLTPGPADEFRLIVTPVEVLEDGKHPGMQKCVRGWIRPRLPIAEFLEQFSRLGGTHHSALVLGEHYEAMAAFGRFAGLDVKAV